MRKFKLLVGKEDRIIPELANQLGVKYKSNLGEYSLKIPSELGSGKVQGINFPNGVGLYIIRANFSKQIELELTNDEVKPLRFIYCLEEEFKHKFEGDKDWQTIEQFQHLISAAKQEQVQKLQFSANIKTEICYLEIDRKKFQDYLSFELSEIKKDLYELFADVNGIKQICAKGYFSLEISNVINQILSYKGKGFPRTNYLGAKALEILSQMLVIYQSESKPGEDEILKKADIEKIKLAADYIDNNLSSLENIPEISRIAGLNTSKIQEGFKILYNQTVNEYAKQKRLEKAIKLLAEGNKNISEVVLELGLSSRSYFSKIFKEKYGLNPKEFVKNTTAKNIS